MTKKILSSFTSLALLAGACAMPAAAENDRLEVTDSNIVTATDFLSRYYYAEDQYTPCDFDSLSLSDELCVCMWKEKSQRQSINYYAMGKMTRKITHLI